MNDMNIDGDNDEAEEALIGRGTAGDEDSNYWFERLIFNAFNRNSSFHANILTILPSFKGVPFIYQLTQSNRSKSIIGSSWF